MTNVASLCTIYNHCFARRELSIAKDLRKVIIPLNLTEKLSLSGSVKMMLDSSAPINCSEASKHSWIDGMEFQPSDLIELLKGYIQVPQTSV